MSTNETKCESNDDNNNVSDATHDHWSSSVNPMSHYSYDLIVASFVRLFVISRIIFKCINDSNEKQLSNESMIKQLVNIYDTLKIHPNTTVILTRLINNGIKIYMNKWHNKRQQCYVIEEILNKILLKQCEKEYYQLIMLITYQTDNIYPDLVFNSSAIFEYFDKDLLSCSVFHDDCFYHVRMECQLCL